MIQMYIRALTEAVKKKDKKACTRLLEDLNRLGMDAGTALLLVQTEIRKEGKS